MKTFRLVSLEVVDNDEVIQVPLESGLIINKEDEGSNWLLEAYTDLSLYDSFKKLQTQDREVIVQAVITKTENDPAYFQTKITSLKQFEKHISVLLEGQLRKTKNNYAELLLDDLLQQGLGGSMLLTEFKDKMQRKPKLKSK